jgi:hypothetical protein
LPENVAEECWVSKEKRTPKGGGRQRPAYGVAARFADGSYSYYYFDARFRDDSGAPVERWGRLSQAARFPSEADAPRIASGMQTNSAAKAYEVVVLPPAQQQKTANPQQLPHAPGSQRSG